jgi:hypothetical protein
LYRRVSDPDELHVAEKPARSDRLPSPPKVGVELIIAETMPS